MTPAEISQTRLANQKITATGFRTAKEIVAWIGAMQAQDFPMAKLAVGTRLLNSTEAAVETAFNQGEILRTHVLRPTWHFVSSDDIYSFLQLTAPSIKSSMKSRHRDLEITGAILTASFSVIEKALSKGSPLPREALAADLNRAGLATNENRLSHLLLCAELEGLICSGPMEGRKQTHDLLERRVPRRKALSAEEALAELARRYFLSHGPATLQDFAWWSGLSARQAAEALGLIKNELVEEKTDSGSLWQKPPLSGAHSAADSAASPFHFLPAYDEFLISYKDRSASLPPDHLKKTVSDNGIFRPVMVKDGQVCGLWSKSAAKGRLTIETRFFNSPTAGTLAEAENAAAFLSFFYGLETVVTHP